MKMSAIVVCSVFITAAAACEDIPFPRLAMWWLDAEKETAKKIARYDLLLNEFEIDKGVKKITAVREKNPSIAIFRPISPTETNWYLEGTVNPIVKFIPSSFFLLHVGTAISESIDGKKEEIRVDRVIDGHGNKLFHEGATVAIGESESAMIVSIDGTRNVLKVERGFVRGAAAHRKGTRIAEHVTFWEESWVMNNTSACPKLDIPGLDGKMNWLELYFSLLTIKDHPLLENNFFYMDQDNLKYDGIVIDRFEDHESWLGRQVSGDLLSLDLGHDNRAVTAEEFDRSWMNGTDVLLSLIRDKFPGMPVIRNNSQSVRFDTYDGQVFETGGWSEPDTAWWENLFTGGRTVGAYPVASYLDWFEKGNKPVYVMVETYEDESMPGEAGSFDSPFKVPGFTPDYRRMRFSLTSTLLGNGYYSYEANTATHGEGGLVWFDEYDNAGKGKGYLGYPVGSCRKLENGAYLREFDNGMVLVNPQPDEVTVRLGKEYRKIKGKQAKDVNDGKVTDTAVLPPFDGLILLKTR